MTGISHAGDGRELQTGETFDNPLERLRLLSGDDDAISTFLDELEVSSPRERQMLAELARRTPLARPERFDADHRRAIEALESLRRHGFRGSRAGASLGPFKHVVRWLVELVRATREHESVVIGSSVRGSLALERAARAWALLDGRGYVVPEDIELLFVPVLVHRVVFTPGFVARARATGWAEAIEEFRASCLELAPRPGSEEDPFFGQPRP